MTNRQLTMWGIAVLTAAVVGITGSVLRHGGITAIDQPGTDWVVQQRAGLVTPVAVGVSNLGGTPAMTALAVALCLVLVWRRRWPEAVLAGVAAAGAGVLVMVGKQIVGRSRPPEADRLVTVANPAFPSGHSLGSIVVIGILAAVVLSRLHRPVARRIAVTVAAVFVVAVGLSRWYLGVHWPTDVLGGWCIGALWLALCLAACRIYLVGRAGVVHSPPETLGMQTPAASDSSSAPPTSAATAIAPKTNTHSSAGM